MDEILKVFEKNHVSPPWSHVLILGLEVIAIVSIVWCIRELLEARRSAQLAKRIETSNRKLYEGARFIAGHAEWAEGSNIAIRVTIGQDGQEIARRNGYSHKWTEVERHTEVAPFYVRTARGERIRVEPPEDVLLVDKLDQIEWILPKWRRRRAELTPGERVIIEGRLERGIDPEADGAEPTYRTNTSQGWVMKPGRRYGMFASTEGLSRRHELRARAFLRTGILVVVMNLVAAAMVIPYHLCLLFGRNEIAQYGGKLVYQERDSNKRAESHYAILVSYGNGSNQLFSDRVDVEFNDYKRLPNEKGHIWIRYVPGINWATELGVGASVNRSWLLLSAALAGLGAYFVVRTHRRRRWYEGSMNEKKEGPLPPPSNERFAKEVPPEKPREPVRPAISDIAPISTDLGRAAK